MFELSTEQHGAMDLDDLGNGIVITKKDFGWPNVRTVVLDRPEAHGVYDTSLYFSDRVVSVTGHIVRNTAQSRSEVLRRIRNYCVAGMRPTLRFTMDEMELYAQLRVDSQSVVIDTVTNYMFTMAWRTDPFFTTATITSSAGHSQSVSSGNDIFEDSPTFPLDFNPEAGPGGRSLKSGVRITNNGQAEVYPRIRINGPVINPVLEQVTTQQQLAFDGIALDAGQQIIVDMESHTAYNWLGDSVLGYIDYSVSEWWNAPVGLSSISLSGTGWEEGVTQIDVSWEERYL